MKLEFRRSRYVIEERQVIRGFSPMTFQSVQVGRCHIGGKKKFTFKGNDIRSVRGRVYSVVIRR